MNAEQLINILAYLSSGLLGLWISVSFEGRHIAFRLLGAITVTLAFNTILLAIRAS